MERGAARDQLSEKREGGDRRREGWEGGEGQEGR